jgi:hypothetical protein
VGKAFAIIFVILLAVMSLAVLVTEEPIETPANEIILSESDFEGNWTSWWVVLELEGPPDVDPGNYSQVMVEHYNNYPIRPQDHWDLQAIISVAVNSSIPDAIDHFDLIEGFLANYVNVTSYDIGDEGLFFEIDHHLSFVFRVKNVIVTIQFMGPADLDPSSILVQELIDLQVSKIA